MNRDARLAVAAARLAVADAGLGVGEDYPADAVALYGATGLAGLPLAEVVPLVVHSAREDGRFDTGRFGAVALKRVRPVLSFRILSNMPVSFVSIFEGIRGPNAVYNPWEGQGARAIVAGLRAIRRGEAACALVGGCDVKTHELAFVALEQQGLFAPWRDGGPGPVPGEGAAFLVLEDEARARARGAGAFVRLCDYRARTRPPRNGPAGGGTRNAGPDGPAPLLEAPGAVVVSSDEDGAPPDPYAADGETVRPKRHLGNLFAAAAAVQVAVAAAVARQGPRGRRVLASCIGHGSEEAAFLLETT
jgi:3-oxoacyl-[acyl-carrier-protein] synthase II